MTIIHPGSRVYRVKITDHVNEMSLKEGFDLAGRKFLLDLAGETQRGYRGYVVVDDMPRGPYLFQKEDLEAK